MIDDPLFELVDSLQAGTADGTIEWQQADSRGRAFIARRSSGTVTLGGRTISTPPASMNTVRLVVKDRAGNTVEDYEAIEPQGTEGPQQTATPSAIDSRLVELWWAVREHSTRARNMMLELAKEFREPA